MFNKTFQILGFLLTTRSSHKIINAAMSDNYLNRQLCNKLGNLKKRGLLDYDNGTWKITELGRNYYKTQTRYKYFDSRFTEKSKKNMLIIFDIPETERSKRDWLRYQLKQFHYIQIQQSVWHGPSPLPKDFMKYVEKIGIRNYIKFFKTSKDI